VNGAAGRRPDLPPDLGMVPNTGGLSGEWFQEDNQGVTRLGIRVSAHLHTEKSPYQKIDVYESPFFGRFLTLDDLMMVTERDEFVYHEMLIHVPLCAMPEPTSVLIIGGGDCGCIREALRHRSIERVVQCEIDERVTRVSERFFPWVSEAIADPRVELVFDDGVRYIEQNRREFDLIVVDSTDPIGPAVGLFLADFYGKVRDALRPGGLMAAQTESPHWNAATLGAIRGQIDSAFRHVATYWGSVPTYPSGSWCWTLAGLDRAYDEFFDDGRAREIAQHTLYYNAEIHRACFMLPSFARAALRGQDPFGRFDRASR
jgi:spermidine synthase